MGFTQELILSTAEFEKRVPLKPYATDNLQHGLKILPREAALKKRYIELNHPYRINFLCFDLDYSVNIFISEDLHMPLPLYFVQNKKNWHAHLIYGLKTPVYTHPNARQRPQNYLRAVIKSFQRKFKADPQYIGLIAKNPCSDFWRVSQLYPEYYELWELCGYVDDKELYTKKSKQSDNDYFLLGRNCAVFVAVKNWAYTNIKDYWRKSYSDWFEALEFECESENAKFNPPLPVREIRTIAHSIARWTWKRFTPDSFCDLQRERVNRRWHSQKSIGLERLKNGASVEDVIRELNVSLATVYRWQSEIKKTPLKTDWLIKV